MERSMFVYKDNFGDDNSVALVLNMYRDNSNLFVGLEEYDEEYEFWDSYCDVTVNIAPLPFLESAINIEIGGQEKIDFLVNNGFGELTDKKLRSGFCEYPVFRFNAEKLKEIDPEFFAKYAKEHGQSVDKLLTSKSEKFSRPITIQHGSENIVCTDFREYVKALEYPDPVHVHLSDNTNNYLTKQVNDGEDISKLVELGEITQDNIDGYGEIIEIRFPELSEKLSLAEQIQSAEAKKEDVHSDTWVPVNDEHDR